MKEIFNNEGEILIHKKNIEKKYAIQIVRAHIVETNTLPALLEGAWVRKNDDFSWTIKTSKRESTGMPYLSYWIRYGTNADGTPDVDILNVTDESFKDFIVCDKDRNDLCFLYELDDAMRSKNRYSLNVNYNTIVIDTDMSVFRKRKS